jgi:hypothetical protein
MNLDNCCEFNHWPERINPDLMGAWYNNRGQSIMRYRLFDSFIPNNVDDDSVVPDPVATDAVEPVVGPLAPATANPLTYMTTHWLGPVPAPVASPASGTSALTGTQKTDDNSDLAMHGPTARSTFNLTGATLSTGATLRIGILSNSFDEADPSANPVATDQADGDLPSGNNLVIVQDGQAGDDDEGRAMAELVHRVAPGAQIYFYSGDNGPSAFATGVNTLVADGCQIIVDDLSYLEEPFFQNGSVTETAVENAVAAGVDYFTSVTNNGTDYYESNFNAMSFNLPGVGTEITHNVSGGSPYETMTLQPGTTTIDLQWGQPFASIGGGAGASYGIGMAVYTVSGNTVTFAFRWNSNGTGQDPVSLLPITNNGSTPINIAFAFYIDAGTLPTTNTNATTLFEAVAWNTASQFTGVGHGVGTGDSDGHNDVPGANTVGAIYYGNTPAFGVTPPVQESFSSNGPGEWLYNSSGALLTTPQVLGAPNISAPDGSATSVQGSFSTGFFGTSAAAPDAAATTALMLQEDGRLTTKQVSYILEATAVSTGNSVNGGAGLVQADTAVAGAHIAITDPLWTGLGGNSLWSNAANWSDDAVPANSGLVVLGNGDGAVTGAYTAIFNAAANVGTLAIDGSGSFDPETPSLTIDANDTLVATNLLLGTFGALDISGDLDVTGALGTGAESVTAGAVTTSPSKGPSGINLENSGLLIVGAGDTDGIAFAGSSAALTFTSSNSTVLTTDITGPITGFNPASDTIDFTGLKYQSGDQIKIVGGIATIFNQSAPSVALANFPLSGTFSSLTVVPDSGTGTKVSNVAPQQSPINDFNDDPTSDVLFTHTPDGNVAYWTVNKGGVQSGGVSLGSPGTAWSVIGTGDFSGNGNADILFQSTAGAVADWHIQSGTVNGALLGSLPPGWTIIGTGDLQGNGTDDIVLRNTNGAIGEWQVQNEQVVGASIIGDISSDWTCAAVGDVNGDGTADLLFLSTSGTVADWVIKNGQVQSANAIGNVTSGWSIVGLGDLKGNGQNDIIWRDQSGDVAAWLMQNGSVTSTEILGAAGNNLQIVGIGDYNGDGTSDILFRDQSGNMAEWIMQGGTVSHAVTMGAITSDWQNAPAHPGVTLPS